jgi:CRISPR-associated protein Csa3
MGKVLLATVWKNEPIMKNIAEYDIEKLILVHEEEKLADKGDWDQKSQEINEIEESPISDVIEIKKISTGLNELYRVAKDVYKEISDEKRDIIVNITGGRKMQAIGTLLAASKTKNVEEALYWPEEASKVNEKIQVPLFNFLISEKEQKVIEKVSRHNQAKKIVEDLEMSQSMVYSHLRELEKKGFLAKEDGWTLTDLGEFMAYEPEEDQ